MFKIVFTILFLGGLSWSQPLFRLSLTEPPKLSDPQRARTSAGQYLNQQLYRHFYRFDESNNYVPELGEACKKESQRWVCTIKSQLKWSDGSPLTAEDFVKSYERILTLPSPRAELLFGIMNARAVHDKKIGVEKLGLKTLNSLQFEILWEKDHAPQDFILMSPLLVPLPRGQYKDGVFSGPYKVKEKTATRLSLEPNREYFKKTPRPNVDFLLYEENLSVEAFNKKEIDFLRRVPTAQIAKFKKFPDFRWVEVIRLDSISTGPNLNQNLQLRKTLAESLHYESLQTLFNSPHRPGCIGLPLSFYSGKEICYAGRAKRVNTKSELKFIYNNSGGDDHRRLAEWLQNQWQTNAGISVSIQGLENKMFLEKIEKSPPDLFRRGLSPENPTCYGAIETFQSQHPDNFLQIKDQKLDELIKKLSAKPTDKELCRTALENLMASYKMIPTGRISFAFRINPDWNHVRINALNHLDLSDLSKKTPQQTNLSK